MTDIRIVRDYPHPPAKVWRALTDPALMALWGMRPEGFAPVVGTRFKLVAKPQPGWRGFVECEVLEAREPSILRCSWLGEDDPTTFFYRGRPYQVTAENGGHVLEVALPFTSRDAVQLTRDGDELQLQVDGLRRTIVLPRALVDAPTIGAKMEDGVLRVRFQGPKSSKRGGRP